MCGVSLEIIGRSSSHFTRVTRIFAAELEAPYSFVALHELTALESAKFAGNPALKMPSLRRADGSVVFGTENICRVLVESAPGDRRAHVAFPEDVRADVGRNAHELLWHAMAAQVQLVLGTLVGKLPAEHPYFVKVRAGFDGALRYLDANLDAARSAIPAERTLSLFDVALFCLVEHLAFRTTLSPADYPTLHAFARAWGTRASARATVYAFDPPPR